MTVIGGADGPTSIFLAATAESGSAPDWVWLLAAAALAALALYQWRKKG